MYSLGNFPFCIMKLVGKAAMWSFKKTTLLMSILFVVFHLGNGWLLRLPCKSEADFDVISKNHYLISSVIAIFNVSQIEHCFEMCRTHSLCESVNHKEHGYDNCELNSKTKERVDGDVFQKRLGWTYYATNYSEINIGSYCKLFTPCAQSQYCIDTCTCPGYRCFQCAPGYYFSYNFHCVEINECNSNPCRNGGVCTDLKNGFECQCLTGYTGYICETDIDECKSNPCQNGGKCIDLINEYTCECNPGYTGKHCETDINECSSNPCQNNRMCSNQVNSFKCLCYPGFRGIFCETVLARNLALKKPAVLSSQYDSRTKAENAVDGKLKSSHGLCAITKRANSPHLFRVDLQGTYRVSKVALKNRVYNRGWNRMNPFDVRIGPYPNFYAARLNEKCINGGRFAHPDQYLMLQCINAISGRWVFVISEQSTIMELCELEVYA